MNKKIISYLLCISILFTVFFIVSEKQVYADNSNVMTLEEAIKLINDRVNSKKKTKFSTINEPYVYPILPGTKEWESFKSKDEMMDACQIPSEIVDSMSTEALTLSVINHPLLDTEVLSYNDYTQGFDSFVSAFDAAKALLEREDFAVNLAKIYLDTPVLNKEEYKEQRSNSQNTNFVQPIYCKVVLNGVNNITYPHPKQSLTWANRVLSISEKYMQRKYFPLQK